MNNEVIELELMLLTGYLDLDGSISKTLSLLSTPAIISYSGRSGSYSASLKLTSLLCPLPPPNPALKVSALAWCAAVDMVSPAYGFIPSSSSAVRYDHACNWLCVSPSKWSRERRSKEAKSGKGEGPELCRGYSTLLWYSSSGAEDRWKERSVCCRLCSSWIRSCSSWSPRILTSSVVPLDGLLFMLRISPL